MDTNNWNTIFEQELYVSMRYEALSSFFHSFEIPDAIAGLDFVDENEAAYFHSKVCSNIPEQLSKRSSSKTQSEMLNTRRSSDMGKSSKFLHGVKSMFKMRSGSVLEEELNISAPTNVKHLQHIGYDPNKGFEVSNIPEEWKSLFKSAGIKPRDLKDKETAEAIIQTVAAFSEQNRRESQTENGISLKSSEQVNSVQRPTHIPPMLQKRPSRLVKTNDPPSAPPVAPMIPVPPPPASIKGSKAKNSSGKSTKDAPPAPSRSNLLSQIREGKKLKKLSEGGMPNLAAPSASKKQVHTSNTPPPVSRPSRGDLLSEIRVGAKLKTVSEIPKPIPDLSSMDQDNQNDLASKIKMMMMMRRVNIKADEEEEDEDDW